MRHIVLLADRPPGQEFAAAVLGPVLFGALTGWMLGVSEPVYLALSIAGIGGGFLAGMEHDVALEGVYRGLLGGLLFGSSILITHGLIGGEPEADLPDPEALLIALTAGFGTLLGWLGARKRAAST
jgi:hypothetical protein